MDRQERLDVVLGVAEERPPRAIRVAPHAVAAHAERRRAQEQLPLAVDDEEGRDADERRVAEARALELAADVVRAAVGLDDGLFPRLPVEPELREGPREAVLGQRAREHAPRPLPLPELARRGVDDRRAAAGEQRRAVEDGLEGHHVRRRVVAVPAREVRRQQQRAARDLRQRRRLQQAVELVVRAVGQQRHEVLFAVAARDGGEQRRDGDAAHALCDSERHHHRQPRKFNTWLLQPSMG